MKFIDLFSGSLKKYLFLCFFLLTLFSCKDDPVKPPDNVEFSINVEDASCIDAWISLKAAASELKLFRTNPFNPMTSINYQIPNDGKVNLRIYDILGNEVKTPG
jgi:hypothetical protein